MGRGDRPRSMRPGRVRPGRGGAQVEGLRCFNEAGARTPRKRGFTFARVSIRRVATQCFNEAGARTPRKSGMSGAVIGHPREPYGFNEAGARTPRKRHDPWQSVTPVGRFNEAGARTPRKSYRVE